MSDQDKTDPQQNHQAGDAESAESSTTSTTSTPTASTSGNNTEPAKKLTPPEKPSAGTETEANMGKAKPAVPAKSAKKKKAHPPAKSAHGKNLKEGKSTSPLAWVAVLALLLTAAVGYGVYYNHQQLTAAQLATQRADQTQRANQETLSRDVGDLQQQLSQAKQQNQRLLTALDDSARERKSIGEAISKLSDQLAKKGRGPLQWRIAEVDYLLTVANHRVILERDVKTAAKALADADERLEAISDPALISVRQKIASEMSALNSVELPDIAGMAVKLSGLVENIESLPLINKERVFDREKDKEGPVSDWQELPAAMWQDIKRLVTIRHNQEPVERLLPPAEIHYLYQNLGLKLEEARIALLQQQTEIFQRHMNDTQTWIQRYFDPESAAVANVVTSLKEMAESDLSPELPDVSASLRRLREWSSAQKQRHAVASKRPLVMNKEAKKVTKKVAKPVVAKPIVAKPATKTPAITNSAVTKPILEPVVTKQEPKQTADVSPNLPPKEHGTSSQVAPPQVTESIAEEAVSQ